MARLKITLSIDENLLRQVRVRAARTGRRDSEVLEIALREGLGVLDRIRNKANMNEEEALKLASTLFHKSRVSTRKSARKPG